MSQKLRSKALSPDVPQYYMRRVFLKSVGATDEDLEKIRCIGHVEDSFDTKTLDMVAANNTVSYGGFFQLASGSAYNITAQIRRPGVAGEIEAKFTYKSP